MKVETYTIKGWKNKETGLLVSENEDWILVKFISGDYMIDGYKIYRKKFIKKRKTGAEEQNKLKVLKLKKVKANPPKGFKFGKAHEMLEWVEKKYGLFEFQDYEEEQLFYGKTNLRKGNKLVIDFVKSDGQIEVAYDWGFSLKRIRSITFGSDYFNAIVLMMNDVKNK